MTYALLEAICTLAEESLTEHRDDRVYVQMYSGRFMFGARCLSISGRMHAVMNLMTQASAEAAEPFPPASQDSMGLGVVLYWPSWNEDALRALKRPEGDHAPDCDGPGYCDCAANGLELVLESERYTLLHEEG